MKKVNGHQIIQLFEEFSPKGLAVEGDPVGLQIGRLNQTVQRVLIALDVVEEVVDEAIDKGVKLIIAHHPIIYRPLKTIQTDQPAGRVIAKLIQHDIAVYTAHTNLDVTEGGVNDLLARQLELTDTKVLSQTAEDRFKKLVVFTPKSHENELRDAMAEAGAGYIGAYSHCTFTSAGTGRFKPTIEADPYIGEANQLEEVEEVRIETIIYDSIEKRVIRAMEKAHPYEEVAYDLYEEARPGKQLGLGRVGYLQKPMKLREFIEYVKMKFDVPALRYVGNPDAEVKKVAVLGGTGNRYMNAARFSGADVYITGDVEYHTAHDAKMMGLNIIDPGHNIEKVMKAGTAEEMKVRCLESNFDVEFIPSSINTDPFSFD
ncbi:Nif3-like dinuclear metal center hexameric protein [Jeotgalibacillus proteolyticus]|uniref:GTP cyclohydrolase 1 type 2 homolog n=1 Tax=Jeotgalibacillus proteolyticus TaxID=2082395 RepID=A0A2S5GEU4_9BACL|nr:Nif3-like dinuclear metal center hexameric protein [Jeotgalibacillus proteolyticus]PPA71435.1 Nif3-like dinuclear metal center hexameric protein [Jeotgalibacillus proteolyticus]